MLSVGHSGFQGRRDFLRVGGLGCLSLADMLAWKAKAAEAGLAGKGQGRGFPVYARWAATDGDV